MKYRAPETLDSGGNWIDKPGTYHLVITGADEHPTKANGEMLDAFRIACLALEGTVREGGEFTERDKTVNLMFFNPKLTDKNEGAFARQKQGKFFLAAGLLTEDQLGQEVELDLADCVGRQIIATLEERDGDAGRTFIDLHFSDVWHIDDPAASKFPKCEKSIKLAPPPHRRDPKTFEKKPNGNHKSKEAKPLEEVDLDDL